ncbi:MAG: response regulator [Syntrophobacteraceae bacterium]
MEQVFSSDNKAVVMADDDADDCMLAKEAFTESGARALFFCVEDGMELLDYLARLCASGKNGLPALILLDLNMPRKDGRAALVEIKSQPLLKSIPIVILTTSGEQRDIEFTARAGADSFITKPESFDKWIEMMKSLAKTWLSSEQ